MQTEITIKVKRTISDLLYSHGYLVTRKSENLLLVNLKEYETPLILVEAEDELYFQLDIIELTHLINDINLYKLLLKLNMELTPLALAIDDSRPEGEILVLVESLAIDNIYENEVISVIENIESSILNIASLLRNYLNKQ